MFSRFLIFLVIAGGGCALDLWSKEVVFDWPAGPGARGEWWIVKNYFGIQHTYNQGALFGMGQGKVTLFASLSIAAASGILGWIAFGKALQDRLLTVALGLVFGGILGNLYDRLGFHQGPHGETIYAVRDWILFCYHDYIWPNVNIADCMLVVGAALLAIHAWVTPTTPVAAASTESGS
ncbi:MAG: signal peptidase II [Planctomycetota bacterium]